MRERPAFGRWRTSHEGWERLISDPAEGVGRACRGRADGYSTMCIDADQAVGAIGGVDPAADPVSTLATDTDVALAAVRR